MTVGTTVLPSARIDIIARALMPRPLAAALWTFHRSFIASSHQSFKVSVVFSSLVGRFNLNSDTRVV